MKTVNILCSFYAAGILSYLSRRRKGRSSKLGYSSKRLSPHKPEVQHQLSHYQEFMFCSPGMYQIPRAPLRSFGDALNLRRALPKNTGKLGLMTPQNTPPHNSCCCSLVHQISINFESKIH